MAKRAYFSDFPVIEYNNKIARNIISRPRIKNVIFGSPNDFYDYVIPDGMRCDQVASYYYGCLLYTSPSPRDKRQSRMPSSA